MTIRSRKKAPEETRRRLVDAAVVLMRRQGFAATSVDQICGEAQVTKGAFFHHFKSKGAIAGAAVEAWCQGRVACYREDLEGDDDPLARLNRMLDGLVESARRPPDGVLSCLLGMVSQELGETNEEMRQACGMALGGWTGLVASLLEAAKQKYRPRKDFDSEQIAWMLNSLWQGSLLVGKTRQDPELIASNFRHVRTYIEHLFGESDEVGRN